MHGVVIATGPSVPQLAYDTKAEHRGNDTPAAWSALRQTRALFFLAISLVVGFDFHKRHS